MHRMCSRIIGMPTALTLDAFDVEPAEWERVKRNRAKVLRDFAKANKTPSALQAAPLAAFLRAGLEQGRSAPAGVVDTTVLGALLRTNLTG